MKERVISEKVVSEKVLGSSSGISRFGRGVKSQISSRLSGVLIGFIFIIASFVVVWYSVNFDKSASLVADLPLLSVEQAATSSGLIKVSGQVSSAPIKAPKENKDVIYYHFTREELEMVKSTETETQVVTRDGQDIEQTIEREVEKPEWVSKIDEAKWAAIVLGQKIAVAPEKAKKLLDLKTVYSLNEEKAREKIEALLPADQLLVVGDIANSNISGGDPFIITNKSNQDLVAALVSSEKTTWWILKIATLLLFGLGLYMLLGPALLILDAIPILGKIGQIGLLIVCLLIGLIFTVLSSLIIAYWYIILILLAAIAGYLIYLKKQQPAKPANS
ncbi:MAG: hypothetical protein A2Y82_01665 [Candidatus Buchananbacteria bacterium RBG_13_36_9]|uniref:Uncharacterized protein n=1 Tax=Candidatus Buchananbacteria bacterium RBG_13_36_9 TaxID=1797530 RepID=A0A1G1XND1_9BACT|nr:MAG: hypothetical protein A2Y82_01665 [Candidatus Buchananbacteria bacterium RBG_13_36_9]